MRMILAALDFNHHLDREISVSEKNKMRFYFNIYCPSPCPSTTFCLSVCSTLSHMINLYQCDDKYRKSNMFTPVLLTLNQRLTQYGGQL